jgi:uncharacterized SAM-binding protein YcdF (DUF218 family)
MSYIEPLLLICFIIAAAGVILIRKPGGRTLVITALASIFLLSWPPVERLFSIPLEHAYVAPPAMGSAEAIVVLSSTLEPAAYGVNSYIPDADTYERCETAAWLYSHGHPLPIVACGGGRPGRRPYSETMRDVLQASGVPAPMIWTDGKSHSTHENAVYGAAILREHGIKNVILVTEAKDMLRAERCFAKEELTVLAYAVEVHRRTAVSDQLMPSWRAIAGNERTLHETLGFFWYWLHGWV